MVFFWFQIRSGKVHRKVTTLSTQKILKQATLFFLSYFCCSVCLSLSPFLMREGGGRKGEGERIKNKTNGSSGSQAAKASLSLSLFLFFLQGKKGPWGREREGRRERRVGAIREPCLLLPPSSPLLSPSPPPALPLGGLELN